ncbi:PRK06851 family protein [Dethiobacter alkaliphilus]|uniref:PRK06851 family protein n=1 Tax=Dethiobacter alkaliphilus TaxID=427926 RepID=UPI002227F765|nr:PRK06851 family protein [Dethiobacter alkaliphilus]MCW3489331.1 PRK06851 family protein [Dethiobacter alkaliphilus]
MDYGMTHKYFAGGNTCRGFHSLFHYIPEPDTKRLIIIKGGPGTGKSTLMKQVGQKAREQGMSTQLFYCSSDNESLDGLVVPALGLAMVDGTAPHVIDPKVPGAYDEILNLGDCWDVAALRPHREEIAALVKQNGEYFIQAYQYLKEAAVVMEKMRYLMAKAMDYGALAKMTQQLLTELAAALPEKEEPTRERHLFGNAITPAGLVNLYPSIFQGVERFYQLTGDPGSGKSTLLKHIYETVLRAGQDVEVYHCGFDPERLDAVVIPALKTAFVKMTYPHTFTVPPTHPVKEQYTLALSRHSRASLLRASSSERAESQERFWFLTGKAVEMIRSAKRNHDQLEGHYIRAMDFSQTEAMRDKIIRELFSE